MSFTLSNKFRIYRADKLHGFESIRKNAKLSFLQPFAKSPLKLFDFSGLFLTKNYNF